MPPLALLSTPDFERCNIYRAEYCTSVPVTIPLGCIRANRTRKTTVQHLNISQLECLPSGLDEQARFSPVFILQHLRQAVSPGGGVLYLLPCVKPRRPEIWHHRVALCGCCAPCRCPMTPVFRMSTASKLIEHPPDIEDFFE